jgi:hypothetical protein
MKDPKRIHEIVQLLGLLWVQPQYQDMSIETVLRKAAVAGSKKKMSCSIDDESVRTGLSKLLES